MIPFYIPLTGVHLARVGATFGVKRFRFEPEWMYRTRVVRAVRNSAAATRK